MFRPNIKLYNLFKNELKLPDAKAEDFVTVLDEKIQMDIEIAASKYNSVLKEDMARIEVNLRMDMAKLDKDLRGNMAKLEMNLKGDIAQLEVKIKDSKVDTIKWMVGIFLTLALMIVGLYIKK